MTRRSCAGGGFGQRGSLEEVRARSGVEGDRVLEGKRAEIVCAEEPPFDQFVGLGEHLAIVGDVPVSDVRAKDRVQPQPAWIALRIKGRGIRRVVGLAAEEEVLGKDPPDLVDALDAAALELVTRVFGAAGIRKGPEGILEFREPLSHFLVAVRFDEFHELGAVDALGVVFLDRRAVALPVVADDVGVEGRGPGDPALEKREAQRREALGDTVEEQRSAVRLPGGGEVSDVVVHVARRRSAAAPAHPARVEGR